MNKNFCAMILTHGRADNVITYRTLEKGGYTGRICIVVDDEDTQIENYKKHYDDKVVIFNKRKYIDACDSYLPTEEHGTILYARNACFDIASELGIESFVELDDDYTNFQFRYRENGKTKGRSCRNLDLLFEAMVDYLYTANALKISFSQGGDFIGGGEQLLTKCIKRKAMNSFFCRTARRFNFISVFNEDVATYTTLGGRGELIFQVVPVMLTQKQTQSQSGGITELYKKYGTYSKSFTSVMSRPDCVKVAIMQTTHKRIHHSINWRNCVPVIINERYKKTIKPLDPNTAQ